MKTVCAMLLVAALGVALLCGECIACGYYFAWIDSLSVGEIRTGFGFAGAVAMCSAAVATFCGTGLALGYTADNV
jgi:hypothetical protein